MDIEWPELVAWWLCLLLLVVGFWQSIRIDELQDELADARRAESGAEIAAPPSEALSYLPLLPRLGVEAVVTVRTAEPGVDYLPGLAKWVCDEKNRVVIEQRLDNHTVALAVFGREDAMEPYPERGER